MAVLKSFIDGAYDSDCFSFKDNTFVCEASDLSRHDVSSLMYDDAIDIGIAIKSARTGVVTKFYCAETHRDNDHDITHWVFLPTSDHACNPDLAQLKVTIFND